MPKCARNGFSRRRARSRSTSKRVAMAELAQEIIPVNLADEMRRSYLDYAMSVIVGRALPYVRDGLKPVHRRVLLAIHTPDAHRKKPSVQPSLFAGHQNGNDH